MVAGRESHHVSLTHAKRDLKMGKIRSPNDAWTVIEKRGIGEIAKFSREIAPGPHNGGLTVPHMNPPVAMANVLMHVGLWSMAINLNLS